MTGPARSEAKQGLRAQRQPAQEGRMRPGYSSFVLARYRAGNSAHRLLLHPALVPCGPRVPGWGRETDPQADASPRAELQARPAVSAARPTPEVSSVQLGGAEAGPPGTPTTALLRQLFSSPTV